jgi:hypothetical protein
MPALVSPAIRPGEQVLLMLEDRHGGRVHRCALEVHQSTAGQVSIKPPGGCCGGALHARITAIGRQLDRPARLVLAHELLHPPDLAWGADYVIDGEVQVRDLLGILGRCDRTLTWINLGFLFVVSLLPFSAALLAHYVDLRLAVGVYWLNIFLLGAGLEWSARYGRSAFPPEGTGQAASRLSTFRRRILVAQTLYALAALICLISTLASVIALAIVQLYFIVSPRLPGIRWQRRGSGPDD